MKKYIFHQFKKRRHKFSKLDICAPFAFSEKLAALQVSEFSRKQRLSASYVRVRVVEAKAEFDEDVPLPFRRAARRPFVNSKVATVFNFFKKTPATKFTQDSEAF